MSCPNCKGAGCVYCKWTGGSKPPRPEPPPK